MFALKNLLSLVFFLSFCLLLATDSVFAQEPPAEQAEEVPAPEAPAPEAPAPEAPAPEAPVPAAPVRVVPAVEPSPSASYSVSTESLNRLLHPEVADSLGLNDQQRAALQSLLEKRTEISASADAEDKTQRLEAIDQQVRDTLNADQLKEWADQGETKNLRFQFREQLWGDVLQWFARQEGLTLVMNQVPAGTFTYTDTRSYSAAEAIDLLNSILLTHGYTLVRREKMLTVLQLSNSIPIELVPRVELKNLPSRGKFELISVLFSLGKRPVDAVMKEVQPYLGSFGRAVPLPQSKQLLVIETAGKMETINVLINTVPEPSRPERPKEPEKPPTPVFASYALGELDPTIALKTIKELIGSERIAVDEKTRLMTAYVVPGQQSAIQSAIEKMRQNLEEAPASVSVAYPLRSGSEEQIREQVTAIAPRATVSIDEKAARVLITAAPEDQKRLADAFTAMGISALESDMDVQAFQVEPAQARVISGSLQSMIPEAQVVGNTSLGTVVVRGSTEDLALASEVIQRWRGTDTASGTVLHPFDLPRPGTPAWLTTIEKVVPQAKIWLSSDAKQLILLGSSEEKTRIETMLPQLLTALPQPPDRVLKTYSLSAAELQRWQEFQPSLAQHYPEVRPIIRAAGEDGSSELVVWATEENQARVSEAVGQVKQATPEAEMQWPKTYDLEKRDPSLFSELLRMRFPGVRVTLDPPSGKLTVWAEPATHAKVGELLAQVADELPIDPELILKSYRVEGRTPVELQGLLAPVIASVTASGSRGSFKPIGTITVDNAVQRLMIMATEEAHQQIDQFVAELSKPLPAEQELILLAYTLNEAQPSDVKVLIDKTIEGASVIADDRRQQLVVTATLAQHGRIKTLLSEVDRPASKYATEQVRAYELTDLQAASVLPTLQSMWPRMKLTVDTKNNRVVASGNLEDHEAFQLSIERLNMAPSGEEMRVQTYDVPMGDLRTLPTVLNQIAPQAIISTDAINRAIIVWASDEQHKRITAAIEQLSATAEGRREIEIYEVAPEKAVIVRYVLTSLFPTAQVGVDAASGQLTVLASKDLQVKIAEVLEKTNKADKEGSKLEPRLYDTTDSIRTAFTSVLRTTVPRASVVVTGSSDLNRLMVLASPNDHERVAALLQRLSDEAGPTPKTSAQAYELSDTDPVAFQTFLAERVPQAKILSGAGTNRLVIAATEQGHVAIEEILGELETAFGEAGHRDLQVYQVRKDLTQQAVTGVTTEIPRARLLPSNDPERIVILASPTEHAKYAKWLKQLHDQVPEPEPTTSEVYPLEYGDPSGAVRVLQTLLPKVVFAADLLGKSIAATATSEDHETIKGFIEQYDNRQMDDAETMVFELGDTDALSLSQAVTQMAPTARVTVDRLSNRLIVTAPQKTLAKITEAVQSMESDTGNRRSTKSYELNQGNSYTLSTAIQGSFPRVKISSDYSNNRLIISATDGEHAEITKLFEGLNSGSDKVTRNYELKTGNAYALSLAVRASFPKATVSPDTTTNSLIVSASEEDQQKITEFMDSMNVGGEKITKNYPLETGDPYALSIAIRTSFPRATISADRAGNSLIVSASQTDHEQISLVIEEMNSDGKKITKNYSLDSGNANTMRIAVLQSFPNTSVGADSVSNSLIVSAKEAEHAQIAELIKSINSEAKKTTKNYALKSGSATSMRYAVQASFPKAAIGSDSVSNSLIVSAKEEEHAQIAELIKSINSEGQKTTKNYALKSGSATSMRYAVQASFPKAAIGSDSVSNSLVVSATEEEHLQIAELVKSINSEGQKTTKNYALKSGKASTMRLAVQASFPKALIGADSVSNSLIVSATEEEHLQIAELVKSINSEGQKTTKNYALKSGKASTMRLAVQASFPKALIGSDSVSNSLIVSATEEEHLQIAELVKSINSEGQKTTKNYALESGNAAAMRSAVQASFPNALVGADSASNSLIVSATDEQHLQIAELVKSINSEGQKTTKNYALESGNASAMRSAVQASFPKALVGSDSVSNSLIISATEKEHLQIAELVKSINSEGQKTTKSYPLDTGRASTMRLAVQASFPKALVGADSTSNSLIVAAREEEHAQIEELIESINAEAQTTTKSYPLESGSAASMRSAVQASFPKATIAADSTSNSLIVSATEEDHAKIATFVQGLNQGQQRTTQSYVLEDGNPSALRLALQATFPQATIGADSVNDSLIVSATDEEQTEIAALVEQINNSPNRSSAMQAYPLAKASPRGVVDALRDAFGRRSTVGVSADEESGTVFVVGLPRDQEIAAQVIEQMDRIDPLTRDRQLRAFSLSGIDGDEVSEAVQSLFVDARPEVEVRYDFYNEQLVVIANQEQLAMVEETLAQFDPPQRELEIFPLQENDPKSVEDAVMALFADSPMNEVPAITVDEDRQQLLIRATTEQLEDIRALLVRLGETILTPYAGGGGASHRVAPSSRVRTITVGRDSQRLLDQLKEVWPTLRKNPLRVIQSEKGSTPEPIRATSPADKVFSEDDLTKIGDPAVTLVATQAKEPESEADSGPISEPEQPAVLILPGDGKWIIASEDTSALEMLATIMEVVVSPPITPVAESGNLSVYVLQHGNAEDLEDLLTELFRQNRSSSRSRYSSDSSQTRIVADTRINALVFQGSRADRGVVEDLLAVLDSPEFIDALQLATPQILGIENTDATRVEDLLRTVYSSQLSRGRDRPQISIPEGVSQEVASMLEQINAEASGPLLTLSVDQVSNSIVMRAPPELSQEIHDFVKQVDLQASEKRSGRMRIIPLTQTNADQIERALQLMRGNGSSGARRRR
ncbi:Bacterial type II/III secretion system short domain protein [Planctomycetes bacterium CA13]|uniref:Bacterial type II/III secretion system short domain protein n=1 Tax=Novipirellula herctigrandis TaxID=2527986 RepID=A0A5C5Z0D4_9BACT|nr:Bacterial type II/III secretion system short domain protein [Planctomycetes bacterium CA13]